jgi:UDP-glucuronate 4-epimerase
MKVLVTGAAGFIGMHVALRLLMRGDHVVGIDNLSDYYDPSLKRARLDQLATHARFRFEKIDLVDLQALEHLFNEDRFDSVVHLAAQAGVRYSVTHPHTYAQSNLVGFLSVLEACRRHPVRQLVYASSSSVYGGNTKLPFSEADRVDHPVSLYAATKKANELMAYSYSHLYGIPATGLRFFTVYGPWGRPDMAIFKFTRAIIEGTPIQVFNHGHMQRDFTYIDDVAEGVVRVLDRPAVTSTDAAPTAPYRIFNIGNHEPVSLLEFIAVLEAALGKVATKELLPMQPGDVPATFADVTALSEWIGGFSPHTPLRTGVARFVEWYRAYYACS